MKRWAGMWVLAGAALAAAAGIALGVAAYRKQPTQFPPVTGARTVVPRGGGFPTAARVNPDTAAARFLAQATFGPTLTDIARVRSIGERAWLDEQFAMPASYETAYLQQLGPTAVYDLGQGARMEAWFLHALGGQDPFQSGVVHRDQLRQRVAFALSQVMVVSDQNGTLNGQPYALASYYDVLVRNAFGNYRQLLEEVTLHPAMGVYLSMLGNRKPDPSRNIRPDENFAREVMQLFSVGLVQLGPDGVPLRTAGGATIPTYDQQTVRGMAHVFTGWHFTGCDGDDFDDCWYYDQDAPAWRTPMVAYAQQHDSASSKQLLVYPGVALANGVLPAGGTARADLTAALDNIFRHPNVGPFIARRLIQRLVTSNPTAGYVRRVAARFNDNGAGVRGDLRAVVAAILLDAEARPVVRPARNFGKVREPILRLTHGWRALNARTGTGRMSEYYPESYLAQAPLRAPSVFNFYSPDYKPAGDAGDRGLVAPELRLATDDNIPSTANAFADEFFHYYVGNPDVGPNDISVDLSRDMPLAANPGALVDRYDTLFLAGRMSPEMRAILLQRLQGMTNTNGGRDRVQEALFLIVNSPEYVAQP